MGDYGANIPQAGDVYHYDGLDGGTIEMVDGDLVMTTGIESAIYDCWFGGNREDDGSAATEKEQWWGNEGEEPEHQSRGRLQSMLDGRPVTSARIPEFEESARDDIIRQMPKTVVSDVSVSVYATAPKRLDVIAEITHADGSLHTVGIKGVST